MIFELRESFNNGEGRERASSSSSLHSKWVLFIEEIRVGEDAMRTGRVSDCYNSQSWSFGLPVLFLLRSLHPNVRFE